MEPGSLSSPVSSVVGAARRLPLPNSEGLLEGPRWGSFWGSSGLQKLGRHVFEIGYPIPSFLSLAGAFSDGFEKNQIQDSVVSCLLAWGLWVGKHSSSDLFEKRRSEICLSIQPYMMRTG